MFKEGEYYYYPGDETKPFILVITRVTNFMDDEDNVDNELREYDYLPLTPERCPEYDGWNKVVGYYDACDYHFGEGSLFAEKLVKIENVELAKLLYGIE